MGLTPERILSLEAGKEEEWVALGDVEFADAGAADGAAVAVALIRRCATELVPLGGLSLKAADVAVRVAVDLIRLCCADMEREQVMVQGVRGALVDAVFIGTLVRNGADLIRECSSLLSVDLLPIAWGDGLNALYVKLLKAEDDSEFAGGSSAVKAAVTGLLPPRLDTRLSEILSVLIPLSQDAMVERRLDALLALRYLVQNTGKDALSWHSEAMYATLTVSLQYRDAAASAQAILCTCELIRALEGSGFKTSLESYRSSEPLKIHKTALRLLISMIESEKPEEQQAASLLVAPFVEASGQRLTMSLGRFLLSVLHLLESSASTAATSGDCSSFRQTAEALKLLFRTVWPRVPSHFHEILPSILSCYFRARTAGREAREEIIEQMVKLLVACRRCGSSQVVSSALTTAVRKEPELGRIQKAVDAETAKDRMISRSGFPFGDFEKEIFEDQGDLISH
ncbi:hypothetical protein NDN08_002870 [Rhodosorus marinus]|uniref:Uncharacterized protein n=1 Tax=Rhodosorus marinus TaxID=101924 RepID=A0AAV8UYG0_9RHOD|nr:hypothetical protein NDN08_002870 [Rhodosorus marinus]